MQVTLSALKPLLSCPVSSTGVGIGTDCEAQAGVRYQYRHLEPNSVTLQTELRQPRSCRAPGRARLPSGGIHSPLRRSARRRGTWIEPPILLAGSIAGSAIRDYLLVGSSARGACLRFSMRASLPNRPGIRYGWDSNPRLPQLRTGSLFLTSASQSTVSRYMRES